MAELRRFLTVIQDPRGYPSEGDPRDLAPPEQSVIHTVVKADEHDAAIVAARIDQTQQIIEWLRAQGQQLEMGWTGWTALAADAIAREFGIDKGERVDG